MPTTSSTQISDPEVPSAPLVPLEFPIVAENAFRIFGVPSTATRAELFAADSRIRRALKLGMPITTEWDLPWLQKVERTNGLTQHASGRLTTPERRLLERLFWFAPTSSEFIKSAPTSTAADIELTASKSGEVVHDLALLRLLHASITDPELLDAGQWSAAIAAWRNATESDSYWEWSLKCDDAGRFEPLANDADVARVRKQSTKLALAPIVEAAKVAANTGRPEFAARTLAIIRGSGFGSELQFELENDLLAPIEEGISRLADEIRKESSDRILREDDKSKINREICLTITHRLYGEAMTKIKQLEIIAGTDSIFVQRSRGAVALAFVEVGIDWTWADDFIKSEELLTQAGALAAGTPSEDRIKEKRSQIAPSAHRQREKYKPVKSPPSLHTINGCGTKLFTFRRQYPGDAELLYGTLYFVLYYIPIIPLRRYVVKPAGGGAWFFIASVCFSKVEKIHLGFLVAIYLILDFIVFSDDHEAALLGIIVPAAFVTIIYILWRVFTALARIAEAQVKKLWKKRS